MDNGIMGIEYSDGIASLRIEPHVQEITRDNLFEMYKDTKKNKPVQLPLKDFVYRECENGGCNFMGVLHIKQSFCPLCYHITDILDKDINEEFDDRFQKWQKELRMIETIINGDVNGFVSNMNTKLRDEPREHDDLIESVLGEEVIVDE